MQPEASQGPSRAIPEDVATHPPQPWVAILEGAPAPTPGVRLVRAPGGWKYLEVDGVRVGVRRVRP